MFQEPSFGDLLKSYRVRKGKTWTQKKVAEWLGANLGTNISLRTYVGWENEDAVPSTRNIQAIVTLFGLTDADADTLFRASGRVSPKLYTIPTSIHTFFFTGREDILKDLSVQLRENKTTILKQAISGLGGVGKTQIAIEYARLHRDLYRAILWVNADTSETLVSGFVALARQLMLPEKDEKDQSIIVEAVKRWLEERSPWLLIFDNIEDLSLMNSFLPPMYNGHVLLTTRSQALGATIQGISVHPMKQAEGALLLLRRAKKIPPGGNFDLASEADRIAAEKIAEILGGLPLALDQAGAYIEETGCSVSDYLERYNTQHMKLLERRGSLVQDHLESVSSTLSLSFEKVNQKNIAAIELLRLSAFLHPDAIPEQLIIAGVLDLGSELQILANNPTAFDEIMEALRTYSLVHRNTMTKTFSIHRLVQAVLRDEMSMSQQRQWAEQTVRIVAYIFPDPGEVERWPLCEKYLLHAQTCADHIKIWNIEFEEAAHLLNAMGSYLYERAQYFQAEQYFQQSLTICKHVLEPTHPAVAKVLNDLGVLYRKQSKHAEAESALQGALSLRIQTFGPEHIEVAESLQELAGIYKDQGRYEQAEPVYRQALAIQVRELGPEDPIVAKTLHNLSGVYEGQGAHSQAESFLLQAAAIWEKALGPSHHTMAGIYNNLAHLYYRQNRLAEAVPLHERARAILENTYGPEHPDVAQSLNNLAAVYLEQGKLDQAEALLRRVITIYEQNYGSEHREMATSLGNLATFYYRMRNYAEAESLYQRTVTIYERMLGPEHLKTGIALHNLAGVYKEQGKYKQAELLYQRAQSIHEEVLGSEHPDVARNLNNLADLYRLWRRYPEAEPLYRNALAIRESALGPEHPFVALSLNNLVTLLLAQGKYSEVEPMLQRALSIWERELGSTHPNIASCLNNLAKLYTFQGKYEQAESLFQRALSLYEHALGPNHPYVALCLSNMGELYTAQEADEQAESTYQRALSILEQEAGFYHPSMTVVLESYAALLQRMRRETEGIEVKERIKIIQNRNTSQM